MEHCTLRAASTLENQYFFFSSISKHSVALSNEHLEAPSRCTDIFLMRCKTLLTCTQKSFSSCQRRPTVVPARIWIPSTGWPKEIAADIEHYYCSEKRNRVQSCFLYRTGTPTVVGVQIYSMKNNAQKRFPEPSVINQQQNRNLSNPYDIIWNRNRTRSPQNTLWLLWEIFSSVFKFMSKYKVDILELKFDVLIRDWMTCQTKEGVPHFHLLRSYDCFQEHSC